MASTRASSRASNATNIELRAYQGSQPNIGRTSTGSKTQSDIERTSTGGTPQNEDVPSFNGTETTAADSADGEPEIARRDSVESQNDSQSGEAGDIDTELASPVPASPTPPPDQGSQAWLILAGSAILQAPVWGFPLAFGIMQAYLTEHIGEFEGSADEIASIGMSAQGTLYLSSPLTFYLLTHCPRLQRWCGAIGLIIAAIAYLVSSFATSFWQLILLQGVLAGFGTGLLFTSAILALDSWFVRRKGMAYGIMWAGKSLTGAGLPFLVDSALDKFGYRWVMRGWAVILVLLSAPLLHVFKPRVPRSTLSSPKSQYSFLRHTPFWTLSLSNLVQGLGYFLPTTYLTLYCTRLSLPSYSGPLLLSLINAVSAPSGVVIGVLNDKWGIGGVIGLCAAGSTLTVLLLWGLGSNFATLVAFSIGYGFFAGGYSSTWSGVVMAMSGDNGLRSEAQSCVREASSNARPEAAEAEDGTDPARSLAADEVLPTSPRSNSLQPPSQALDRPICQEQEEETRKSTQTSLLFGLLAGGRGLGNILSGPLSAALLEAKWNAVASGGYGTEYGPLILFTGISALLGGWGYFTHRKAKRD